MQLVHRGFSAFFLFLITLVSKNVVRSEFNPICSTRFQCKGVCHCEVHQNCFILKLDERTRNSFLYYHNQIRDLQSSGVPQPSGLTILEYDRDLEDISKCWAGRCSNTHSDCFLTSKFNETSQSVVQLILEDGETPTTFLWLQMMEYWLKQAETIAIEDFHRLPAGKEYEFIHNFAQVMSDNVLFIGCAWSIMDNLLTFVCTYGPRGPNTNERIYRLGKSCSTCPEEFECNSAEPFIHLCKRKRELIQPFGKNDTKKINSKKVRTKNIDNRKTHKKIGIKKTTVDMTTTTARTTATSTTPLSIKSTKRMRTTKATFKIEIKSTARTESTTQTSTTNTKSTNTSPLVRHISKSPPLKLARSSEVPRTIRRKVKTRLKIPPTPSEISEKLVSSGVLPIVSLEIPEDTEAHRESIRSTPPLNKIDNTHSIEMTAITFTPLIESSTEFFTYGNSSFSNDLPEGHITFNRIPASLEVPSMSLISGKDVIPSVAAESPPHLLKPEDPIVSRDIIESLPTPIDYPEKLPDETESDENITEETEDDIDEEIVSEEPSTVKTINCSRRPICPGIDEDSTSTVHEKTTKTTHSTMTSSTSLKISTGAGERGGDVTEVGLKSMEKTNEEDSNGEKWTPTTHLVVVILVGLLFIIIGLGVFMILMYTLRMRVICA